MREARYDGPVRSSLIACCGCLSWLLVGPLAACNSATAPPIFLSIALADGRACTDAAVLAISIERRGQDAERYLCDDTHRPNQVRVGNLPLYEAVRLRGESTDGAELYRGSLIAADVVTGPEPAATVTLYPYLAR